MIRRANPDFRRLRDYRSPEHLLRMDDADRAALFEDLFRHGPGEKTWQGIGELFANWPEGSEKAKYFDLAEQNMASWKDELRFAFASDGNFYTGENLNPLARLVRRFQIYRQEEHGSSELLAIANSPYSSRLNSLSIVHSEISSRAWQAMVDSATLVGLQELEVVNTSISPTDIALLFESDRFLQFKKIRLVEVGMKPESMHRTRSDQVVQLREIDFSDNALGDEGILLLARSPWLGTVERLTLRRNFLTASAIHAFLSSPYAHRLQALDVSENRVALAETNTLHAAAEVRRITVTV
ncbi:MAG: hypothetical protein WB729_21205 [Candidatus Sulfotelmatobacter sp.]